MRFITALFLTLAMSSCGGIETVGSPRAYNVQSGDTLYLVAWKYKLDYRELASWNNIAPPYTIMAGQRLIIDPPRGSVAVKSPTKTASNSYQVRRGDTVYSIARTNNISVSELAKLNNLDKNFTIYPQQVLKLSQTEPIASSSKKSIEPSKPAPTKTPAATKTASKTVNKTLNSPPSFIWPTSGKVRKAAIGESSELLRGIFISGNYGQEIRAIAAGKVVYDGTGLPTYGKLLIIQHDDTYSSAYAHNASMLVKKHDYVVRGQVIATMGKRFGRESALQLEIRENGKTVDPLLFLPKR